MPTVAISQKVFSIGQDSTFKIFGDDMLSVVQVKLRTSYSAAAWGDNVMILKKGKHHVKVTAHLNAIPGIKIDDNTGDLTITVIDGGGQQDIKTINGVTYM